jgi:hypothetical protein
MSEAVTRRNPIVLQVSMLTASFASLPFFIKMTLGLVEHHQEKFPKLVMLSFAELIFIPITMTLYTISLAIENSEHIRSHSNIVSKTIITGIGGLLCLALYAVYVAQQQSIAKNFDDLTDLQLMAAVLVVCTLAMSFFTCAIVHRGRSISEERNV